MTCDLVLEALLNAEPEELSGQGSSALTNHLRTCSRCLRLATQLHVDTRLLAAALPAATGRRQAVRRTRYAVLAPVALVAAVLVLTVMRSEPTIVRPVAAPAVVARLAPEPVTPPRAVVPSANNPVKRAAPSRARLQPRAFPPAVAVQPIRLTAGLPRLEALPATALSVDPPVGTRAVVMHTNNPKLVVVWLY